MSAFSPEAGQSGALPSEGRQSDAIAQALRQTRQRTMGLLHAWVEASPDLRVPCRAELNLPLWEWGHVAWFQSWWIGRNRQRHRGTQADPDHHRAPSRIPGADDLYDSARVPHSQRWNLDLPGLERVVAELDDTLSETLQLLERDAALGHDLYFWHLVRAHEDMHAEASVYMAQSLGLPIPSQWALRPQPDALPGHASPPEALSTRATTLRVQAQVFTQGYSGAGFCFDNERSAQSVSLSAFEIDARPVTWGAYLDFIGDTGYPAPDHLRRCGGGWEQRSFDRWAPIDLEASACFLNANDAQAWCRWAGRALPTEAQWERVARDPAFTGLFKWGDVWEWTASTFEPYPGFVAHPYREYSAPWFGTHRVLRGASRYTSASMISPTYRNFFLPTRRDVPAGFRTVALQEGASMDAARGGARGGARGAIRPSPNVDGLKP